MPTNKGLTPIAIYWYDEDKDQWTPFNPDRDVNGALVVSSYNRSNFYTGTVTITSAGTAQQGPAVQVPAGFAAVIKGRDGNTGNVFFARSQTDAQTSANRVTVVPGASAKLYITNLNLAWFDAATSNDVIELFVER